MHHFSEKDQATIQALLREFEHFYTPAKSQDKPTATADADLNEDAFEKGNFDKCFTTPKVTDENEKATQYKKTIVISDPRHSVLVLGFQTNNKYLALEKKLWEMYLDLGFDIYVWQGKDKHIPVQNVYQIREALKSVTPTPQRICITKCRED